MLRNLFQLLRYRGLVQSLVARELKARYRGSVLGFLWSFINPLLLLGWIDNSLPNSSPDYKRFKAGEVADICSSAGAVPTSAGKRGGYSVAPYWSNSAGACVS